MNPDKHVDIVRLIVRSMEGKLSEEETRELAQWRAARPRHDEIFRRMTSEDHFIESVRLFVKSPDEQERQWRELRRKTVVRRRSEWIKYAAAILIPFLCIGGWIISETKPIQEKSETLSTVSPIPPGGARAILMQGDGRYVDLEDQNAPALIDSLYEGIETDGKRLDYTNTTTETNPAIHTLSVPRGGEYTLILADGSRVYLNAESQLEYPVAFTGPKRQVSLKGEAYFEIAKNPSVPFVVTVENVDVEVLGTEFAVRAYTDESHTLTTLVKGAVKVRSGELETTLAPSEQADIESRTGHLEVRQVDVTPFVAWRHGRIVFDNTPLETILGELSRWYDMKVIYLNEDAKKHSFSLNMEKYTDFREILRLMEQTGHAEFTIADGYVMVN